MKPYQIYAIISMFFAGITAVIAKAGLQNVKSDTALAVRTIFVFSFVWLNIFLFNNLSDFKNLSKSDVFYLAVSALTTAASWIFYYKAIKLGPVSEVALIDKASILITIIFAIILFKEPVTPKLIIGSLLVIGGFLVLTIK